jgi:hypothetical protein
MKLERLPQCRNIHKNVCVSKLTHLYSFQEDNWAKDNWTKTGGAVGNTLGNLGNILGGKFIHNVMGTY